MARPGCSPQGAELTLNDLRYSKRSAACVDQIIGALVAQVKHAT